MRNLVAAIILAAITLGQPAAVRSQSVPNLSGTWVLQPDKSDFGIAPAPTSQSAVVDHQEPNLKIKRSITLPNGQTVTNEAVYAIDGKPHTNSTAQGDITSTLKWEGPVLVIVGTGTVQGNPVTVTDRFTISDDGKTLSQQRVIAVQGQEIPQTLVFAKQP